MREKASQQDGKDVVEIMNYKLLDTFNHELEIWIFNALNMAPERAQEHRLVFVWKEVRYSSSRTQQSLS